MILADYLFGTVVAKEEIKIVEKTVNPILRIGILLCKENRY